MNALWSRSSLFGFWYKRVRVLLSRLHPQMDPKCSKTRYRWQRIFQLPPSVLGGGNAQVFEAAEAMVRWASQCFHKSRILIRASAHFFFFKYTFIHLEIFKVHFACARCGAVHIFGLGCHSSIYRPTRRAPTPQQEPPLLIPYPAHEVHSSSHPLFYSNRACKSCKAFRYSPIGLNTECFSSWRRSACDMCLWINPPCVVRRYFTDSPPLTSPLPHPQAGTATIVVVESSRDATSSCRRHSIRPGLTYFAYNSLWCLSKPGRIRLQVQDATCSLHFWGVPNRSKESPLALPPPALQEHPHGTCNTIWGIKGRVHLFTLTLDLGHYITQKITNGVDM